MIKHITNLQTGEKSVRLINFMRRKRPQLQLITDVAITTRTVVPSNRTRVSGGEKPRDHDLRACANDTKFCACEKPSRQVGEVKWMRIVVRGISPM